MSTNTTICIWIQLWTLRRLDWQISVSHSVHTQKTENACKLHTQSQGLLIQQTSDWSLQSLAWWRWKQWEMGEQEHLLTPGSFAGFKMLSHLKGKKVREMEKKEKASETWGERVLLALAFSSGALGEAPSMAAVLVCVHVRETQSERPSRRRKGVRLHPSFTPTTPYRHIHTNLHAAAVA